MTFSNPIVGGTTLIRPAIKSPDYIAATSGWSINKDGTAEFNDVTFRGSAQSANYVAGVSGWKLDQNGDAEFNSIEIRSTGTAIPIIVGGDNSPQVLIATDSDEAGMSFPTNRPNELVNGGIIAFTDDSGAANERQALGIFGPTDTAFAERASMRFYSQAHDNTTHAIAEIVTGGGTVTIDENDIVAEQDLTVNNIQSGIEAVATIAGQWVEVTVNFPHAFNATPVVVVTGNNNAPAAGGTTTLYYACTTVTTTSFVLRVFRQTAINMNIGWIAISA